MPRTKNNGAVSTPPQDETMSTTVEEINTNVTADGVDSTTPAPAEDQTPAITATTDSSPDETAIEMAAEPVVPQKRSETVPGGRYLTADSKPGDEHYVDANGNPIP